MSESRAKNRKTSAIWNIFTRIDGEMAECDLCQQTLSYKTTISNLRKHMQRKHGTASHEQGLEDVQGSDHYVEEPRIKIKPLKMSKSRATKRQTSEIWNFFTRIDAIMAKCDLCKQTLSHKTSISNLKRHMERKHGSVSLEIVLEDGQVNDHFVEDPRIEVQHNYPKPGSTTEQETKVQKDQPGTSNIASSTALPCQRQQSIRYFTPKKKTASAKKKIDEALINMFILDFQPFSIVEDEGFVNFVKELNPGYILPARKTISKTLIPALYEKCLTETKKLADNIRKICITTDCWTSRNNESCMAVTGHFIDSNFTQHSILLDCSVFPEGHTSVNLATELQRVATEWGVENKILIAVSNNAANIKNAISEQLCWRHFGCFAHTINLIVMSGLKNDEIETVILKVRAIVTHFKSSSSAQGELMAFQENNGATQPKKIILDVVTRWNSTFYMIERFLELEDAIVAILDAPLQTLTVEEWSLLRELCTILRPFEHVTKAVSGEKYMSASLVIVLTSGLKNVCSKLVRTNLSERAKLVLTTLQMEIETHLGKIEENETLAVCTFLDPRFKNLAFQDPETADRIKNLVIDLVSEYILERDLNLSDCEDSAQNFTKTENSSPPSYNENNISVWDTFDIVAAIHKPQGTASSKAIVEVQHYLDDALLPRDKDPLQWWSEHAYNYPNLGVIVQERYCALGTSVPCEKCFSDAGMLLNERRASLSSTNIKYLISLHFNSKYNK